jgi:prepilin-type N-terminal cleavage/methylation domain-containing protein
MKRSRYRKKGFTLLELLMVVIIIAILASIALPQFIRAAEKSRAAEAFSTLGAVRSAEIRYAAQNLGNNYTKVFTELDVTITPSVNWSVPTITTPGTTGFATVARLAGQFKTQMIGIQFGTGTICGNFAPLLATAVTCAPD